MTADTLCGFAQHERHLLPTERGIGQRVVQRLASAGLPAPDQLRRQGVARTVRHIAAAQASGR